MSAALDSLASIANEIVSGYTGKRRPSWAPSLAVGAEFASVLRDLGLLKPDSKDAVRLHAIFSDPKRGPVTCWGFDMRAKESRKTQHLLFRALRRSTGEWTIGPRWLEPCDDDEAAWQRYRQRQRSTELATQRVLSFADAPFEEMKIGGLLTGECSVCGRRLRDPVSIERGIGPECWGTVLHIRKMFDDARRRCAESESAGV
jgi:hypothetical protein